MATLAAAVWFLYGSVTRLWWTVDAIFDLHLLSTQPPLALLFSPRAWSSLPKMFVPLQLLSYHLDLALFGRSPQWFYTHQLLSLVIAGVTIYATLRMWLPPFPAWASAGLAVLGVPFSSLVIELPSRHYVEGLIWASLALLVFVKALRRSEGTLLGVLSALLYFLSILEKEVYVPLPVLLAVLPESTGRSRLRLLRPHAFALILYIVWRRVMLGTLVGGYGWAVRSRELPGLLAGLPLKLLSASVGGFQTPGVVLLGCLLAGAVLLMVVRPASALPLAACALCTILPILPVAKAVGERFATLPWILATIALVLGSRAVARATPTGRLAGEALLVLAIAAALVVNRQDWRRRYADSERMSAEGRFFLTMSPGDLLRHPRIPPAAMKETRWLREESLRLGRGGGWYADDVYLCLAPRSDGRVWEYDSAARKVRDVTERAWSEAEHYCANLRSAPLSARFESAHASLFWTLGPYQKGSYALILDRGVEAYPVGREDGYRMTAGRLSLMVRYESPEGWVTYSPELIMDFQRASSFRWERPAAASSSLF